MATRRSQTATDVQTEKFSRMDALVTSGGIGQAVARQLLQEGACVMLTDIDA